MVIAIFIFGCVSASLFKLIIQTDRIRGRAFQLENCTRLASSEAERLRSLAAQSAVIEDSTYTVAAGGRTYTVKRHLLDTDLPPSFTPRAREPVAVEIRIVEESGASLFPDGFSFKLLVGQENP